jgi:hypothetical protein
MGQGQHFSTPLRSDFIETRRDLSLIPAQGPPKTCPPKTLPANKVCCSFSVTRYTETGPEKSGSVPPSLPACHVVLALSPPTDAYVGIRTTSPLQPLDVNGLIRVSGVALPIATESGMCIVIFGGADDIFTNKQACAFGNDGRSGTASLVAERNVAKPPVDTTSLAAGAKPLRLSLGRNDTNLAETVKQQQKEIESLKKLVCLDHPEAEVCK